MGHRFQKHYTVDEARSLLPQIRDWLGGIQDLQRRLRQLDQRLGQLIGGGVDAGGESVNSQIRSLTDLHRLLQEFAQREIQIKDPERGLIDFPALMGDREVFLCWEQDDEDIEFWHDLDSGYAGRERL